MISCRRSMALTLFLLLFLGSRPRTVESSHQERPIRQSVSMVKNLDLFENCCPDDEIIDAQLELDPNFSCLSENMRSFVTGKENSSLHGAERDMCSHLTIMCCLSRQSKFDCQKGIEDAQETQDCTLSSKIESNYSSTSSECCQACKLAMMTGFQLLSCNMVDIFTISDHIKYAYRTCCEQKQYELNPPERIVLMCPEGYVLNPSRRICENWTNSSSPLTSTPQNSSASSISSTQNSIPTTTDKISRLERIPSCDEGYRFNPSKRICEDIDECLDDKVCPDSHSCFNTPGKYICARKYNCGTGYRYNLNADLCEDVDECSQKSDICGPRHICKNTPGTYRCVRVSCPPGQKLITDGSCRGIECKAGYQLIGNECEDINECNAQPRLCPREMKCINYPGSYRCKSICTSGMRYNSSIDKCVDIDECVEGTSNCQVNQICQNLSPGYSCVCPMGYMMNALGQCEDIDECQRNKSSACPPHSYCVNFPGYHECFCEKGFKRQSSSNNTCVDIDECAEQPWLCPNLCKNTYGSYTCTCGPGYELSADGLRCLDIDECSIINVNTQKSIYCNGICRNMIGSYECDCPEGYRLKSGQKRLCVDIDECKESRVCSGRDQYCLNSHGSFKCYTLKCPDGYAIDGKIVNRCINNSTNCSGNDHEKCRIMKSLSQKLPRSHSYFYVALPSKPYVSAGGLAILMAKPPKLIQSISFFSMSVKVVSHGPLVKPASRNDFMLRKLDTQRAELLLKTSLEGPQDISITIEINNPTNQNPMNYDVLNTNLHISPGFEEVLL
ncbi:EGF-containing fibulin-like extracellular matrix protein 1 [Brevipalpus obovatus]|uniref:EGF-containing fibulin-like extracellular matrix protein 1 n=1 Tax=Brevipalpus obovatus TaxID=246614 RepID=UPI003D9DDF2F